MTGELSGMPTRNDIGTHVFVVIAYDGSIPNLTANKVLTLVVDSLTDVGVTIVTPEALVNGKVGESYRYALAAAGGSGSDYTWTLINPNALPQGLFLDSATGEIWGVPSLDSAGVYAVAVRVEDAQGNSSVKSFDVTIHTEFSDPGLIAAAQSDGAGGGCALQNGVSWLLLASIIVLLSALAIRRREQA